MFLTPDGRPFFGGTYFPPRDREGSSGFLTIVTAVAKAWAKQRAEIEKTADAVTEAVRKRLKAASSRRKLPLSRTAAAEGLQAARGAVRPRVRRVRLQPRQSAPAQVPPAGRPGLPASIDDTATAPRPNDGRPTRSKMVVMTLDRMARGGIRDHLGGGYHRYSTDRFWLVPHFEKMLYDNAQLAVGPPGRLRDHRGPALARRGRGHLRLHRAAA